MTVTDDSVATETQTMAAAFNSALDDVMGHDDKVIVLGEDIADPIGGVFKITKGLSTKYGKERVRPTPISETAIIGAAIGASMAGYRPVAEIMFMDFLTVCIDQLVNHAAKLRYMSGGHTPAPITVRTTVGSQRFGAQHAQNLEAWLIHAPGLKVVYPSTPEDAKGLLTTSILDDDPCVVIEHSGLLFSQKGEVPTGHHEIPLGQAATRRAGDDITLIAYGPQVPIALSAAERLAESGVSAEVIDLRTLMPLDIDTVLESVTRTRRAVIIHEATRLGGVGAEISSQIHEELFGELLAPVGRLGGVYSPVPFAKNLPHFPTPDSIIEAVRDLTGGF